jgi:adenylate cyclase class 2
MKEVEIKAKIASIAELKERLTDLGCFFSKPVMQEDAIFLPQGVKYTEIKKGTPVVRIRSSAGLVTLTLKKRIETEIELIKIEKEVIVNNKEAAIEIIEQLGFYKVIEVNKEREECSLDGLTVCLDAVQGLGNFIEVEKLSAEDDTSNTQEELLIFLNTLGITKHDAVSKGYDTLIYELKNR